tara:strand:+ start:203 stop:472 length:270 start_codon:yes stop_codon:yes gene_type:complete
MSHHRVKTTYNESGSYGSIEKRTIYADHNNSCDIVSFYDEQGDYIFSVEDTVENNLVDAINKLMYPFESGSRELSKNIEYYQELPNKKD